MGSIAGEGRGATVPQFPLLCATGDNRWEMFPVVPEAGMFSGSLLIADASEEYFQSCLEWKWTILLQLSPLALLVARLCQGEEQKPVTSILFSQLFKFSFCPDLGLKSKAEWEMLEFPSREAPFLDQHRSLVLESRVTCNEEGSELLGRRRMPGLVMLLAEDRVFSLGHFCCLWHHILHCRGNYRIQMVMAKSNPPCDAPFVAAAALGTEMGFGSRGPALLPPSPYPVLAWQGSAGVSPTCSASGNGHLRGHLQGEGLCRFMLKYSCVFLPRLFLLICKCNPLFCVGSVSLMVCQ